MRVTEMVVNQRAGVELEMREESTRDMLSWRLHGVEWSGRGKCDVVLFARVYVYIWVCERRRFLMM
jgi:hypothetical protein